MISIGYVNGTVSSVSLSHILFDPYVEFASVLESIRNDMIAIEKECNIANLDYEMSLLMEDSNADEKGKSFGNKISDAISKLGDKIIEMTKKFVAFINSILDKFKERGFEDKSSAAKLEALCKEHPELKDEIIARFNSGELKISDARSVAELENAFDAIMKMQEADPSTLKGKWEATKKKFEENSDFFKSLGATVTAAGTVITIGWVINASRGKSAQASMDIQRTKEEMTKKVNEYAAKFEKDYGREAAVKYPNQTKAYIINDAYGRVGLNASMIDKVFAKINTAVGEFIDKHSSDESKKQVTKDIIDSMKKGNEAINNKNNNSKK